MSSSSSGGGDGGSSPVYLITGSTDGIGRHTALQLAKRGATVLIHGRNPQRVSDTVSAIQQQSGSSSVTGYTADMSDLAAVRQLAAAVAADHPQLHALVNNAGVYETKKR